MKALQLVLTLWLLALMRFIFFSHYESVFKLVCSFQC